MALPTGATPARNAPRTQTQGAAPEAGAAEILLDPVPPAPPPTQIDNNSKVVPCILANGDTIMVPSLYTVVAKTKLMQLEKSAATLKKLKNHLHNKKFKGTVKGKQMLAVGIAHAPLLSFSATEMVVPCILASFFADIRIYVNPAEIVAVSPCKDTLSLIINECGMKMVCNMRDIFKDVNHLYLACDKGNKKKQ